MFTYRYIFLNKKYIYILVFLLSSARAPLWVSTSLLVIGANRGSWPGFSSLSPAPDRAYQLYSCKGLTSHNSLSAGAGVSKVHCGNVSLKDPVEGPSSIAFLEPGPTGTDRGPQAAIKGEPRGPGELAKCRRNAGLLI